MPFDLVLTLSVSSSRLQFSKHNDNQSAYGTVLVRCTMVKTRGTSRKRKQLDPAYEYDFFEEIDRIEEEEILLAEEREEEERELAAKKKKEEHEGKVTQVILTTLQALSVQYTNEKYIARTKRSLTAILFSLYQTFQGRRISKFALPK